jgi:RNA polymerase sigma factor (TIGR02999 family)
VRGSFHFVIAREVQKTRQASVKLDRDPVTQLFDAASEGDRQAAVDLIPLVYGELRKLAAWRLANEAEVPTLQATALVHEAYLRLSPGEPRWQGRRHFFNAAAEAMRRILIDRARQRKAVRHGGELHRTGFAEDLMVIPSTQDDELLAIHEILDRFAELEPRKAEVVKLRYFVGMSIEETAEALGISTPTAKRDWTFARAWLFRELQREA